MKPWIAPSILAADFACLGQEVEKVIDAGADLIHFDVMDNHFVPNLTFGPDVCRALHTHLHQRGITTPLDVHLMVEPVDQLVESFAKVGAEWITVHQEACPHLDRTLQLIHSCGCKAGVALNPATSPETLKYVMDKIDLILVMSVNPGFGGQVFIDSALDKIAEVKKMIEASGREIRLQVDGGVNLDNVALLANAGADCFVAGSAIFRTSDYEETLAEFHEAVDFAPYDITE
ncbi:ribulose-phosphate 3-epimerase [Vibrio sp. vnigr-6D03]|uniref:ribulose-phosphate 3-epimerase n=1 Tax=Vibrio sp. vnigr-6D03 TaxID=2058088 RepID=UPI000C3486FA|nr:ribulose-phosphate 3-epimerase [Vibrio sp. vnigr-6D03]PKF77570.1 ribulose-phosphate 3-epimerase [Vibrio sp. vnigr-6D03]